MHGAAHWLLPTESLVDVFSPADAVIATVGPSCQDVETLCLMLEAGMTCVRIDLTVRVTCQPRAPVASDASIAGRASTDLVPSCWAWDTHCMSLGEHLWMMQIGIVSCGHRFRLPYPAEGRAMADIASSKQPFVMEGIAVVAVGSVECVGRGVCSGAPWSITRRPSVTLQPQPRRRASCVLLWWIP